MTSDNLSKIDSEKVDAFVQLIKKNGLPNFKWAGTFAMGSGIAEKFNYAELKFSRVNGVYNKSIYTYKKKPLIFLHFTTAENAIEILRSKMIRIVSTPFFKLV